MNIFVLDTDPRVAAEAACDKHIVKMTLETAQILCTVVRRYGGEARYKPSHVHHPCTVWAGETRSNFQWLIEHGRALAAEYKRRYGKAHASALVIEACDAAQALVPPGPLTPFAQAMPEAYRNPDPVTAYRSYYRGEKAAFAKWKLGAPGWWMEVP